MDFLLNSILGIVTGLVSDKIKGVWDQHTVKGLLAVPVKAYKAQVTQWCKSERLDPDDVLPLLRQAADWLVGCPLLLQHFDHEGFRPDRVFDFFREWPSYEARTSKMLGEDKAHFDRFCLELIALIADGLVQTNCVHNLLQVRTYQTVAEIKEQQTSNHQAEMQGIGQVKDELKAAAAGKLTRAAKELAGDRWSAEVIRDAFEGQVRVLSDDLFGHPASKDLIQRYYGGAPLDWDIIAARGDIKRDKHAEAWQKLTAPCIGLHLVSIVAEPGAGKSTLAWRLAAGLHQAGFGPVLQVRGDDAGVWYRISEVCEGSRRQVFALVDDLFRQDDTLEALQNLSRSLPLTVLATSRANEYRPQRIRVDQIDKVTLEAPSEAEKDEILRSLGLTRGDLSPEQRTRLERCNQFLVLMMELTSGKDLYDIVRDSVERLREIDEAGHRAYEYLTFAGRLGVFVPESVLESLDPDGRFHHLPERDTLKGIVFRDEERPFLVRPGHPLVAGAAYSLYESYRSPSVVLDKIAAAIDTGEKSERLFLWHLLRQLAREKSPLVGNLSTQVERVAADCVATTRSVSELVTWSEFWENVRQPAAAAQCIDLASTYLPVSQADCLALMQLHIKRGSDESALGVGRLWLVQDPEGVEVRIRYLGLVERKAGKENVAEALRQTQEWLLEHPNDTGVRARYLGLVERKGTHQQMTDVVGQTREWLGGHTEDINVTLALIALMIRLDRKEEASELIQEALRRHSSNQNLLFQVLRFLCNSTDPESYRRECENYMQCYPRDSKFKAHYAAWLRDHGFPEEARDLYASIVREHPRLYQSRYGYGQLLLGLCEFKEAQEQFRAALQVHKGHQASHFGLAKCLHALGLAAGAEAETSRLFREAETEFKSAIYWADKNNGPQAAFHAGLGWFYVSQGRPARAEKAFRSGIDEDPEHFVSHWGLGQALLSLGRFEEAKSALLTAVDTGPEPLEPPASEEIPELLRRCEEFLASSGCVPTEHRDSYPGVTFRPRPPES